MRCATQSRRRRAPCATCASPRSRSSTSRSRTARWCSSAPASRCRSSTRAELAIEPRRRSVQCASPKGLHRIAYLEWGDPRNRDVLVCVHGLTRSAQDFDSLARELCGQFRVVCPDVAGRGDSDRLADPMLYAVPQYVADMVTLIARLDVESVHWVGTSMGGLIGMALAAQAATPVRKLVLNEAGPVIGRAALERSE